MTIERRVVRTRISSIADEAGAETYRRADRLRRRHDRRFGVKQRPRRASGVTAPPKTKARARRWPRPPHALRGPRRGPETTGQRATGVTPHPKTKSGGSPVAAPTPRLPAPSSARLLQGEPARHDADWSRPRRGRGQRKLTWKISPISRCVPCPRLRTSNHVGSHWPLSAGEKRSDGLAQTPSLVTPENRRTRSSI